MDNLGARIHQNLCPFHVLSGLSVYSNDIAFVDKHRDIDVCAGFEYDNFRAPLGGVAASVRRSLGHLEIHFDRKLHAEELVFEPQGIHLGVALQEFSGFADQLVGYRKALRFVFGVMEEPFPVSLIDKDSWLRYNFGFLELVRLLERILNDVALDEML